MNKKIRRIRVVPKRYTFTDEVENIANEMLDLEPSKVHLYLTQLFGMADKREMFGFYLNYRDVVFDIHSVGDKVHVGAYIAPRFRQSAERKKVKIRNIVARTLNLEGKVYVEGGKLPSDLYFSVRQKNDELYRRAIEAYGDSDETRQKLENECMQAVGDKLSMGFLMYAPEVADIAREFFQIFIDNEVFGMCLAKKKNEDARV